MDPREVKLPVWVRELIAELRRQVRYTTEPMVAELSRLRPQVELLRKRNDALTELLECAAKGGHKDAQQIVEIIHEYGLVLQEREDS